EGAGTQRALVCVRLHFGGTGRDAGEIFERPLRNCFVSREQRLDGLAIKSLRGSVTLKTGRVVTAFPEVLIASRALLAIPALLVGDHDGGKDGKALDGQRDVGQVGDRAVPVLKVEGVEKFFRLL